MPLKDLSAARTIELEDNVERRLFSKIKSRLHCCLLSRNRQCQCIGDIRVLKEIFPASERHLKRFNDGAVDAKGRFWAGEIDLPAMAGRVPANHEPTGRLYRFDPDGTLTQHESGILCSNGIGWSPDNTKMYYNDSLGRIMHQYDFDLERGTLSNGIIFVDQRTIGGEPDGLVVDTRGNVWTAMFGKGCVECYNPEGTLVQRITVATRNTTCPGWARADLSTMFITSAENEGREEFRQEKQEFAGDLFYVKLDIAGLPKFRFG